MNEEVYPKVGSGGTASEDDREDSSSEEEEGLRNVIAASVQEEPDEESIVPLAELDEVRGEDNSSNIIMNDGVHAVADNNGGEALLDAQWRIALAEMNEEELDEDEDANDDAQQPALVLDDDEDNPNRMRLSKEEREWAQQIKAAIEEDPDLDNLTDFAYAQYALVEPASNGLEAVIERAQQMQAFREDKKLLDNPAQAKRLAKETMDLFPGFFLSIYFDEVNGGCTFVFDSTKLVASTFSSNPKAYDNWISIIYYVLNASNPDFTSIRNGLSFHVECDGFDFMKNFGIKVFSKSWTEVGVGYPLNWNVLKHFHTSMFKNLLVSMAKRFIPREIHSKFQVGCICELGRLDKVYLVPNETAANERFESKLIELLQRRQDNEKAFSL